MSMHPTIYAALAAVVHALGIKRVVAELWPARDESDARRYLLHCLDPDRSEKLGLEEMVWVMRAGSRAGLHDVAEYLGGACLYEFRPVSPGEAEGEIARALDQTVARATDLLAQLRAVRGRS